jgi:hypothetical protein
VEICEGGAPCTQYPKPPSYWPGGHATGLGGGGIVSLVGGVPPAAAPCRSCGPHIPLYGPQVKRNPLTVITQWHLNGDFTHLPFLSGLWPFGHGGGGVG